MKRIGLWMKFLQSTDDNIPAGRLEVFGLFQQMPNPIFVSFPGIYVGEDTISAAHIRIGGYGEFQDLPGLCGVARFI